MSGDAKLFYILFDVTLYPFHTLTLTHTKVWVFPDNVGYAGLTGLPQTSQHYRHEDGVPDGLYGAQDLLAQRILFLLLQLSLQFCVFPKLPNIYDTKSSGKAGPLSGYERFQLIQLYLLSKCYRIFLNIPVKTVDVCVCERETEKEISLI